MFLVTEERIKNFPGPVQILFLCIALAGVCALFYYSFWEAFHKVLFTDEPHDASDIAAVILAFCNILVIVTTAVRILKHTADEIKKKLK